MISGRITLDTLPSSGVEALLVRPDGGVQSAAESDAEGRYQLDGAIAEMWVMFRLRTGPVVGVVVQPAAPNLDLALSSADAVLLSGSIAASGGEMPPWIQASLTPRALEGVPPDVMRAVNVLGTGPAQRGSLWTTPLEGSEFQVRVFPAVHELRFEHVVDGPSSLLEDTKTWAAEKVILPSGEEAEESFGAFLVEVHQDTRVHVELSEHDR